MPGGLQERMRTGRVRALCLLTACQVSREGAGWAPSLPLQAKSWQLHEKVGKGSSTRADLSVFS